MTGKILYRPVRAMNCPEATDPVMIPITSGSSSRPAMVGELPLTICRYSGRAASTPNMPIPTIRLSTELIAKVLPWNSRSGSRASSPIIRSATTNSTTPSAPMPYMASDRPLPQPQLRPCSATISSGTRAMISATAPRPVDPVVTPHVRQVQHLRDQDQRRSPRSAG